MEQRRLVAAFLAAAERGDLDGLLAVLAPDVAFVGDGGGHFPSARKPITGDLRVARFLVRLYQGLGGGLEPSRTRPVELGDTLGVQSETVYLDGRPLRFVMWFTVSTGRITGIFTQLNPEKLVRVPALGPDSAAPPPR